MVILAKTFAQTGQLAHGESIRSLAKLEIINGNSSFFLI